MIDFLFEYNQPPRNIDTVADLASRKLGEQIVNFIGSGSFGYTFLLKSGRVLKITKDKNEINLIYNLVKSSNIPKSLMTYYNVGHIKDTEYFYILMDKIEPLSDNEKNCIYLFTRKIQYNTNYYNDLMDPNFENEIKMRSKNEEEYNTYMRLLPHIKNIVKDLKKYKIPETDFHSGNLGWNKDYTKLIMFDLGGYIDTKLKDKFSRVKSEALEKKVITKFSDFQMFESIRDEYPGMFNPRKPEDEPQSVPGFENGTIDPDDDDVGGGGWLPSVSDKERYQDFLKIIKKRNIKETKNQIIINLKRLWHDFYMSIYNPQKYYRNFLIKELVGKYVSKGFKGIMDEKNYKGIIEDIEFNFDDDSCYINLKLEDQPKNLNFCEDFITIDKMKTDAKQYNL